MKYVLALRLIYAHFLNAIIKQVAPTGVDMLIQWTDEEERHTYYGSFSPVPSDDQDFDSFGYPDDEIFYYFADFKELIRYIFEESPDGWRVLDANVFYDFE